MQIEITNKTNRKSLILLIILVLIVAGSTGCAAEHGTRNDASGASDDKDRPVIAVAWHNNQESYSFVSTLKAIEAAGAEPVVLDMVQSTDLEYDDSGLLTDSKDKHDMLKSAAAKQVKLNRWQHSNAEEVMSGFDCIVFPGGSDISPTLYYKEQEWHGIEDDTDYNAERDVSDYLLMTYCLDEDIPILCICRGMQMLATVSGADMIQDVGQYLEKKGIEYHDLHRDPAKEDLVPHQVVVKSHSSILYEITGMDIIKGVPSWHHQLVKSVKNTALQVTAYTLTDGVKTIEGVERRDKDFVVGVQFHPEVAVRKVIDKEENAGDFMDYDTALSFFTRLIEEGEEEREEQKEQTEKAA